MKDIFSGIIRQLFVYIYTIVRSRVKRHCMGSYIAYTPAVATIGSILLGQGWYIFNQGSILLS